MPLISKALIVCLIAFFALYLKMLKTGEGFVLKNGERFSILDLQLPKSKTILQQLIANLGPGASASVLKQLKEDYFYMIAAYIGVALMCLVAKDYVHGRWIRILEILAFIQILPWIFDIIENIQVKNWVNGGAIPADLTLFKAMVIAKFAIALGAVVVAIVVFLLS